MDGCSLSAGSWVSLRGQVGSLACKIARLPLTGGQKDIAPTGPRSGQTLNTQHHGGEDWLFDDEGHRPGKWKVHAQKSELPDPGLGAGFLGAEGAGTWKCWWGQF